MGLTLMKKRYVSAAAIVVTFLITSLAVGAPMIFSSYLSTTRVLTEPVWMIFFGVGLLFLANYGRKKIPK
jgi:hypothetical protein